MTDTHRWKHEPRIDLTDKQKAKLFLDRGGRCHRCTRKLRPADKWSVEHLIALENGGTNDWDNLDLCCSWCKPKKDAEDHALAAKGRDIAVAHLLPREERRGKGRPMPGSRRSGLRKHMDGRVERWRDR